MKKLEKQFYHWCWGENHIRKDKPNYLINLEIGLVIRFTYDNEAMFSDFDFFVDNVIDVQFWSGNRPDPEELHNLLVDAYNFLGLEERILENDLNQGDIDFL